MKIDSEVRDRLAYLFIWWHRVDTLAGGDGELLLNWLLGHYSNTPRRIHEPWVTRIDPCFWPDFCCVCGANYGVTPAGRIRRGCPSCRNEGTGEKLFAWRRYTGRELDTPEFYRLELEYGRYEYET